MAELLWFYHVAYQYEIRNGLAYCDTTILTKWRIDNDEKFRELRDKLNELSDGHSPSRLGSVVITGISLLAPGVSE